MNYKKLTKKFILILIGLASVLIIPLIIYDPLHLYHKSWFSSEDRLHGNMRLQAAGIINNYEFDSMIVGTSMLAGTSAKYASEMLGGRFVNVSAPAGGIYERNLFLRHALRSKNIKHVVYSFDTGLDANLKKNDRSLPLNKFNYLYDNNPINDIYAYWNNKFLKCMLTFSENTECIGGNRGLIRSDKWVQSTYKSNKTISGINKWLKKDGRGKFIYSRLKKHIEKPFSQKQYKKKLALTYKIIDEQLLETIEENKEVSFHIVFPPYSRLQYALWLKYNPLKYTLYKKTIKYLQEASQQKDNMFVYLLDDLDYLNNLNNYRDMRHYNTDMNNMIIDYIHDKKYVSTDDELNVLFKKIDSKNNSYTTLDTEISQILDAYKFRYSLTQKQTSNGISIEGWALSYKVTNVELHINNKKIKSMRLTKRKDIDKQYPDYNQLRSGFMFNNIKMRSKKDKISLIFKNKNRIIKKLVLKNEQGEMYEK